MKNIIKRLDLPVLLLLLVALLTPLFDAVAPEAIRIMDPMRTILVFSIMGLGLNIVTGYTGLLSLGIAAFMAIGAYSFAISTCDIYPFRLGFWPGLGVATLSGTLVGFLLGLPAIRLRGDYLAIVTLGFGEIIQDLLKNLDVITKGTQGINPLPSPTIFGLVLTSTHATERHYLLLGIVILLCLLNRNIERSGIGRAWIAIREDELAAKSMGIHTTRMKLYAFACTAALCSLAGGLWVSLLGSTGEPGNYDFQASMIVLCAVIVGGLGSIRGVLGGTVVMIGLNAIVLSKLSTFLAKNGLSSTTNVFSSPNNWKYMLFGLALILIMRFKPDGVMSESSEAKR